LEGSSTTPSLNWEATAPFVPETLGTSEILPHDLSTTRLFPNICPEVIRAEHDATAPPRTTTSSIRNEKNTEDTGYATLCFPVFQNLSHNTSCYLRSSKEFPNEQKKNKNEKNKNKNKTRARSMRVSFLHQHLRASTSANWKERKKKHTHKNNNKMEQESTTTTTDSLRLLFFTHCICAPDFFFVWLKSLKPGILSPSVRC
jgi:hypothetical protein